MAVMLLPSAEQLKSHSSAVSIRTVVFGGAVGVAVIGCAVVGGPGAGFEGDFDGLAEGDDNGEALGDAEGDTLGLADGL